MRFLGNWCSTTFRVGENPLCPELSVDAVPWAVPEPQGCSPCSVPGQGCHCLCWVTQSHCPGALSAQICSLPWLKAEQTLLPGHLHWATLSSHQKSTCMSGAFQNRHHQNDHGDKVSLTLTHFCCVSYRLVFWFYYNKRGLLSLVFPILHPKGCLWKQGYMHVWGRAAALWNKGSAHNPLEGSLHPTSEVSWPSPCLCA